MEPSELPGYGTVPYGTVGEQLMDWGEWGMIIGAGIAAIGGIAWLVGWKIKKDKRK